MQPDQVKKIDNSIVQHGPANDRVYLMKLSHDDLPDIVGKVYDLGRQHGYTKLFAKVSADAAPHFTKYGFVDEARVPNMYKGESAGLFMCKYLDQDRSVPGNITRISEVLNCAEGQDTVPAPSGSEVRIERLRLGDVEALAALYDTVFETYPFPMHDPNFVRECMEDETVFFGIYSEDKLVAAASAEMDTDWQCAEMTDFATLPEYRGNGAATHLLYHMEDALADLDIHTLYTIARAESFGMNIVFSRCGYTFGGTLHNNTQIAGKLESMNVWHKQIGTR
ncbi:GCN5-related N-acetyltransferase [Pseudodesulfovibrio profundus]|uniref:GCN5-related N-acetyltransferase n=1 Tax=Pseudodesulfovibrio profundus TaxID=57320 RepID=A0A2C8F6P5_9BACT|nr:putative beta-lysine N-acetyltransferase [Pseudodesulfovibrio profundus]MBC16689.1 putative beta-lysine N-acetyltransferase [Desulfovibrio sp.]SOB58286.1 GCN5-related N-acetyltransferase [Pseudodesulfovibrio profundus]|tara:strand:+ start:38573 stop:39412 length:840 start_codon:yes stop_codon:yes gene_type:complete